MKKELSYIDSVHRAGRIWNLSVMVLLMLFPAAVSLLFERLVLLLVKAAEHRLERV